MSFLDHLTNKVLPYVYTHIYGEGYGERETDMVELPPCISDIVIKLSINVLYRWAIVM